MMLHTETRESVAVRERENQIARRNGRRMRTSAWEDLTGKDVKGCGSALAIACATLAGVVAVGTAEGAIVILLNVAFGWVSWLYRVWLLVPWRGIYFWPTVNECLLAAACIVPFSFSDLSRGQLVFEDNRFVMYLARFGTGACTGLTFVAVGEGAWAYAIAGIAFWISCLLPWFCAWLKQNRSGDGEIRGGVLSK